MLFAHAGEAVTVQDRSGLIFANDEAARMVGLESGREMVATPIEEIVADYEMIDRSGNPFPPEALPGRRVLQGEPVAEEVIGYRKRGTGDVRWSRLRSSPIKNDAGEVVWALNFFLDVTEEVRRAEDERLLSLARETLGSSLEIDGTLSALANLLVPGLARVVAVHLVDDAGFLNPVGVGRVDAGGSINVHRPVRASHPLTGDRLQARVVASRAVIMQGEFEDLVAGLDAGLRPLLEADLGSTPSIASLPLGAGERVLGTLTVARASGEGFNRNDLALLRSLTDRAAVAFSNALLFSYERKAAEVLQQGLMPARPPHMRGWRTAMRYLPQARISGVGGDFYDVLLLGDRYYAVVVGDVEGKGIEAAATVTMVRHAIRATTSIDPDPRVVFGHVNDRVREQSSQRMCTLAYLTLQASGDVATVRVALAGHPPPVFVSREGDIAVVGSQPSPPAGVVADVEPVVEEHKMSSGDTLVLCTDGFAIGDAIPPDSLRALLEGAHERGLDEIVDRLMARLRAEHPEPRDDVILLALRLM